MREFQLVLEQVEKKQAFWGCFYGQTDRQRNTFEEKKINIQNHRRTNKDVVCEFEFNRFNRFGESMEKKKNNVFFKLPLTDNNADKQTDKEKDWL